MENDLSILGIGQNSDAFGQTDGAQPPISQIPKITEENNGLSTVIDELPIAPIDENPLIASDEDLIEREWIDRAKQIVEATKSDPHKQDDEINKLQADYINKRYSKNRVTENDNR